MTVNRPIMITGDTVIAEDGSIWRTFDGSPSNAKMLYGPSRNLPGVVSYVDVLEFRPGVERRTDESNFVPVLSLCLAVLLTVLWRRTHTAATN